MAALDRRLRRGEQALGNLKDIKACLCRAGERSAHLHAAGALAAGLVSRLALVPRKHRAPTSESLLN